MQPLSEQDERRMYADQAAFDPAYTSAGRRAPPPLAHERPREYVRRLVGGLLPLSPRWARADVNTMSDDAFAVASSQIRADAIANGRTAGLRPGEIKQVETQSSGGHRIYEFVAVPDTAHFTQAFSRTARIGVFRERSQYEAMSRDAAMAKLSSQVEHAYRPPLSAPRSAF
jgi:hypothetical protein